MPQIQDLGGLAAQFLPMMGGSNSGDFGVQGLYAWQMPSQEHLSPQEVSWFQQSFDPNTGLWASSITGVYWLCPNDGWCESWGNAEHSSDCSSVSNLNKQCDIGGCYYRNSAESVSITNLDLLIQAYQSKFGDAGGVILCTAHGAADGCPSGTSRCVLLRGTYSQTPYFKSGTTSGPQIANNPETKAVFLSSQGVVANGQRITVSNMKVLVWMPGDDTTKPPPTPPILVSDLSRCQLQTSNVVLVVPIDEKRNLPGTNYQLQFDIANVSTPADTVTAYSDISSNAGSGSYIWILEIMATTMAVIFGLLFFIKWYRS